jgi:hypothetical protein
MFLAERNNHVKEARICQPSSEMFSMFSAMN